MLIIYMCIKFSLFFYYSLETKPNCFIKLHLKENVQKMHSLFFPPKKTKRFQKSKTSFLVYIHTYILFEIFCKKLFFFLPKSK